MEEREFKDFLKKFDERGERLERALDQVVVTLRGVPEYKQKGLVDNFNSLVDKVEKHEERLEKIDQLDVKKKIVIGTTAGLGGGIAGFGGKALLVKILTALTAIKPW